MHRDGAGYCPGSVSVSCRGHCLATGRENAPNVRRDAGETRPSRARPAALGPGPGAGEDPFGAADTIRRQHPVHRGEPCVGPHHARQRPAPATAVRRAGGHACRAIGPRGPWKYYAENPRRIRGDAEHAQPTPGLERQNLSAHLRGVAADAPRKIKPAERSDTCLGPSPPVSHAPGTRLRPGLRTHHTATRKTAPTPHAPCEAPAGVGLTPRPMPTHWEDPRPAYIETLMRQGHQAGQPPATGGRPKRAKPAAGQASKNHGGEARHRVCPATPPPPLGQPAPACYPGNTQRTPGVSQHVL
jgi:hypothetical protein